MKTAKMVNVENMLQVYWLDKFNILKTEMNLILAMQYGRGHYQAIGAENLRAKMQHRCPINAGIIKFLQKLWNKG